MISNAIAAIREVVEALGQNIPVHAITEQEEGVYKVYLKSTLWLRAGNTVSFGEVDAVISAIGCNNITVTAEEEPTGDRMSTAPIYFMHGTVVQVNNEMLSIRDAQEFTPLVYYVEASSGQGDTDPKQQVGFDNDARLLVLMSCNNADWLNAEHYTNVIEVTEDIWIALVGALNKSPKVVPYIRFRVANHANVGSYTEKGTEKNLFDFYFSGIDVKFNLPLRQTCNC